LGSCQADTLTVSCMNANSCNIGCTAEGSCQGVTLSLDCSGAMSCLAPTCSGLNSCSPAWTVTGP
jgi:hypothetical protein